MRRSLLENLLEGFFIWFNYSPSSYTFYLLTSACRRRTGKGYEIGRSRYFEHAGNAPKLIHDSDVGSTHAL
ncbi:hypothetical protein ALC57_02339 [Trachymyrmex cornetzi]|uniref:Uncharacterized protein n=1 Tax=Trachymyrmex cornetzi TaxID=471704 RepID=A0A195EJ48_9HYME|nr:hypothetical protein ALC57_02339 [Trachymyrmex cornetzi]